jgi:5'-nucleotidase
MRILITNDDGIRAPGLLAITDVAKQFGVVKVVAPDRERSCCGHAMTMREPLRATSFEWDGCEAFEVNGLPVDCINVGLTLGWPDGCDLILSGINNGPNLGFDITYSGTVAGAMEGTINKIRSISVSMAVLEPGVSVRYDTAARWLSENWDLLVMAPLPELTFLNVNIPNTDFEAIQGHRVVDMGHRVYEDRVERRDDPWGRPYYWQGGVQVMNRNQPGTDVQAVMEGFVSLTPLAIDWTATQTKSALAEHFGS